MIFVEQEAILIALEDAEVDSGVFLVDEFLQSEHFTERSVRKLAEAAELLAERSWREVQRRRGEGYENR